MSTTTIYNHPDGYEITVGDGLLTVYTSEGQAISLPIRPEDLSTLGVALMEHSIAEKYGDAAERTGAGLGSELLNELLVLRGRSQSEALRALHSKLLALRNLEHFDRAAGGFAVALVALLELGIENLPKAEGK